MAKAASPKPRLVVKDVLTADDVVEPSPQLRIDRELLNLPPSASFMKPDEAAQMREALQLRPEQIIENQAKLAQLEKQLQQARVATQSAQAQAASLQTQLQTAQEQKYQNPVVYSLAALAVGATGLWLLERRRRLATQPVAPFTAQDADDAASEPAALPAADALRESVRAASTRPAQLPPQASPVSVIDPATVDFSPKETYWAPWPGLSKLWWRLRGRATPVASTEPTGSTRIEAYATQIQPSSFERTQMTAYADDEIERELRRMRRPAPVQEPPQAQLESQFAQLSQPAPLLDEMQTLEPLEPEPAQAAAQASESLLSAQAMLMTIQPFPSSGESVFNHLRSIYIAVNFWRDHAQYETAIDFLSRHIDALPQTSAWAYLELLELALDTNNRTIFEATRHRYRMRFNRLAPYWMEKNTHTRDLLQYDRIMAELCGTWPTERAQDLIEHWVLGNAQEKRIFDLPAYRDLLGLYELMVFVDDATDQVQFLPTVSLLDLDYEFTVDYDPKDIESAGKHAVPTVKLAGTGMDVDVDLDSTQSRPAQLEPKPLKP
jgi:hypothetical protein